MAERATKSQRDRISMMVGLREPVDTQATGQSTVSIEQELSSVDLRESSAEQIRYFWERRKFIGDLVGIGFTASLALALLLPNRYTSTTQLMPPDSQSNLGIMLMSSLTDKGGSGLGALGSSLLGLKTTADLFVGVISSRTVQSDLVNKFDLKKVYRETRQEDACKKLANHTSVSTDRRSGIVTIEVSDKNAGRARAMAAEYVAALDGVVTTLSTSSAHRERMFLETRLSEVQDGLESSEKALANFSSKSATFDIKEQGKAMMGAAAAAEGELIGLQTELRGLRQLYTDNNARVRALSARVAELQAQLRKLGGDSNSATQTDSMSSDSIYPSLRQLPVLGVTYADLYRRTAVQEAVFETLTKEYELAKVEEAKEIPSVQILDPANLPEQKSFPPRLIIILVGTSFAFGVAIFFLYLQKRWVEVGSDDPRKVLAVEIESTIRNKFARSNAQRQGE